MDRSGKRSGNPRVIVLSAFSAFLAPLVFVSIIVMRKAERRLSVHWRLWSRRLQHEIARWS